MFLQFTSWKGGVGAVRLRARQRLHPAFIAGKGTVRFACEEHQICQGNSLYSRKRGLKWMPCYSFMILVFSSSVQRFDRHVGVFRSVFQQRDHALRFETGDGIDHSIDRGARTRGNIDE